jgi:glyoxylase-like metal-dependent hydrolase (beta-lactamase superfamily II)
MKLEMFTVGAFQENTFVLSDPTSGEAYIIDPGGENHRILKYLKDNALQATAIINTHGHIDHVAGVRELQDALGIPFRIHAGDKPVVDHAEEAAGYFGVEFPGPPTISSYLEHGERLPLGDAEIEVVHTPGHSPGGVCFKIGDNVIVGDTLFMMSIGRTDLPGGNHRQLMESIKRELMSLDDRVRVFPGHGPATTIGQERARNPFLT